MDYPVLNKAPDVALAVVTHYVDGSGNAVPASSANPTPIGSATLGASTDAAQDQYDAASATISQTLKGILKGLGKQLDGVYGDGTGAAAGTMTAFLKTLIAKGANVVFSAGNGTLQTNATGTTYNTLSSQVCKSVTVSNQTGTTLDVQQGGSGAAFQLPTGQVFTFRGLSNASSLGFRRTDTSNTQVTASYRYEA